MARGGKSGIQINCAEDCFVSVGEQPLFRATAGFLFAGTEPQEIAQVKLLGGSVQGDRAHQSRKPLRQFPGIPLRKCVAEHFAGDEAEHAVAEKFETFVVRGGVVLAARSVG